MSDVDSILSPLFGGRSGYPRSERDPADIYGPFSPDSDPIPDSNRNTKGKDKSRKHEKESGLTPHDATPPKHPFDLIETPWDPTIDGTDDIPTYITITSSKSQRNKNHEKTPILTTQTISYYWPEPLVPYTSTLSNHRFTSRTPITSLPPTTYIRSTLSTSMLTTLHSILPSITSSSMFTSSTTLHTSTTTSAPSSTFITSQTTPTLVNANADTNSQQSDQNIAIPIIIGVLAGVFMIAMVVFAVRKMKRKRKNNEDWTMYKEEPWRNPFRESLDQYHSHY
ncbi:hypothetical protein BGW37DRAFT_531629 [Umbelopsis sp. PMI_123]|nr:hypothetical protein BGW37DRAFT_531629 [Umbelopsis sp. PMI_123]